MKRFLLMAVMLVAAIMGGCQTQVVAGRVLAIQWDQPDLGAIPAAEISYEVAIQVYPAGAVTTVGTVVDLESEITFPVEGPYRIGVRTKRTVNDTVLYSDWLWADVGGLPVPWYVAYYEAPPKVVRVWIR